VNPPVRAVVAILVTYASRATLCCRAADRALQSGASLVVIVDNGSDPEAATRLDRWSREHEDRTVLVRLPRNEGSAVGFASGIEAALARVDVDYLWLLDDDNDPAPEALGVLLAEAAACEARGLLSFGLFSLRPDRKYLRALSLGGSVERAFPSHSSFLSFNVADRMSRWREGAPSATKHGGSISGLPYGPFGGFLVPAPVARANGVPDARLVLYEDDTEYTNRLHENGVQLVFVPGALVDEQEQSWYAVAEGRGPLRMLRAESNARVYFSVRNRVYLEHTRWRKSRLLYRANKLIFTAVLVAGVARRPATITRFRLVRRAIADGEHGRLGDRPALWERL
jgi:GT2 family glycosyltransferase